MSAEKSLVPSFAPTSQRRGHWQLEEGNQRLLDWLCLSSGQLPKTPPYVAISVPLYLFNNFTHPGFLDGQPLYIGNSFLLTSHLNTCFLCSAVLKIRLVIQVPKYGFKTHILGFTFENLGHNLSKIFSKQNSRCYAKHEK